MPMIQVKHLTKTYLLGSKKQIALDDISFEIQKGEILGLVGESGSGKSTLARILLGLDLPDSGNIFYDEKKITGTLLPKKMQMVFQDPYSSLNPRMKIGSILKEPTQIHKTQDRTDELLNLVGLPRQAKDRYPHEFSGGQRQRIAIARALALNPELLICDEPISALDVSIQAQIVNLLLHLQKTLGLTILFISHDLLMVQYVSTRVLNLHQGKLHLTETKANPLYSGSLPSQVRIWL